MKVVFKKDSPYPCEWIIETEEERQDLINMLIQDSYLKKHNLLITFDIKKKGGK